MENLLKVGGDNYDLDMDVLLKKSMDPVDEGGDSSKKEEKAKKSSKKELQEESPEVTDSDPQKDTSKREPIHEGEANEASAAMTTDTTNGDLEDDDVKVASEELTDVSGDECAEYKAKFFKDSPLTDKFIVVRVNDDLAQKIRVVLWRYPDLSTSSYVNNILQHHFDEFRSVLETMAREVSESVIEVML